MRVSGPLSKSLICLIDMIYLVPVLILILTIPSFLGAWAFKGLPNSAEKLVERWLFLAPFVFAVKLFVIITSPLTAGLTVLLNLDDLPFFFKWMGTHDDTIDGLKNGYKPTKPYSWKRYITRIGFLSRNPAYGFMYHLLGIPLSKSYRRQEPFWDSGKGIEYMWSDTAIQARGKLGPLYVWFGWKIHTPYKERVMFALDINLWNVRMK